MGAVDWGISTGDIDNFDREKQFAPYRGQIPPNAVYRWRITQLKFSPATGDKFPQLRIGVELVPRNKKEQSYKGFRLMSFRVVAPQTPFNYVPLLDALGVSSSDFKNRTMADGEGNITRIGKWRNNGAQEIDAQLASTDDEKYPHDIKWIGAVQEVIDDEPDDSDDDDYLDDEEYDNDIDDSGGYDDDDWDYDDD